MINRKSDGIRIAGHKGTWYVIDETTHKGQQVFLLEHERYGDEAAGLWVDSNGTIIVDDVWNGRLDLEELE